jgi:hypothetical protein
MPFFLSSLFMGRSEQPFEKIYERDRATNSFIISVAIEKYADIFNELDPAPFRKKDLDHDLRIYLEDSSLDIPIKHNRGEENLNNI